MAHMTVQRKTMEMAAQDVMTDLYEQGGSASKGWAARVKQVAGRLFQPRESRFLDPRLNAAHDRAMSQIQSIHNLTR
ncbi:MAG: hypothetical protein EHM39_13870 [Chloroflexi bacterium]|nr:MAG: hypothetical protein EHM39_13870 [Chloroflexota bacterium]